jgi:3-oxoacyl-[acyl-carrier protein] reductase
MINLRGETVLITGGSRGIGAATAEIFAKAGANVAITWAADRRAAEAVVRRIRKKGRRAEAFHLDLRDSGRCRDVAMEVISRFGTLDTLVNNAGIWEYGAVDTMTPDEWKKTIDINLTGIFNMCNAVVPYMKKRKRGRIINISSTAGQRGEAFHSHYAASKGGTIAFTKSIAAELIRDGIYVNCVAPGWVETDMTKSSINTKSVKKEIVRTIPRGKVAQPYEIAGPILFLGSSLSDNIVGEILNVNGGSVLCG